MELVTRVQCLALRYDMLTQRVYERIYVCARVFTKHIKLAYIYKFMPLYIII